MSDRGYFGDTFDLDGDGQLNDFEEFMDFNAFMDQEEEFERQEAEDWDEYMGDSSDNDDWENDTYDRDPGDSDFSQNDFDEDDNNVDPDLFHSIFGGLDSNDNDVDADFEDENDDTIDLRYLNNYGIFEDVEDCIPLAGLLTALSLQKRKLDALKEDTDPAERAQYLKKSEEVKKILVWGKTLLADKEFIKIEPYSDCFRMTFHVKNTSGLDFHYLELPVYIYDQNDNMIETFMIDRNMPWWNGDLQEYYELVTDGFPVRAAFDFKNLKYAVIEKDEEEEPKPYLKTEIAGTFYVPGIRDIVKDVHKGDQLILVREPENAYDPLAIRVETLKGAKLGYIPRKDNAGIAFMMDGGEHFYAKTISKYSKTSDVKIKLKIYHLVMLERYQSILENNSVELRVDPIKKIDPVPENTDEKNVIAVETENKTVSQKQAEKTVSSQPEEQGRKRERKTGIIILLIIAGVIILSVAAGVAHKQNKRAETAKNVWEQEIKYQDNAIPYDKYDRLSEAEKKVIDYRVLICLKAGEDSVDYYHYEVTFEDVADSYLKTSGSALYADRAELYEMFSEIDPDDLSFITADMDFGHYGDAASNILSLLSDDSIPDDFKDIIETAYGKELKRGCIGLLISDITFPEYYGDTTASLARSYLNRHNVEYQSEIDRYIEDMSKVSKLEDMPEEWQLLTWGAYQYYISENKKKAEEAKGELERYKLEQEKKNAYSSSSTKSSSKQHLNGWADYDEGYDDVMYNDEYDEDRYQTDSEYASGVDDARDEYEEVYGEEFD